MAQAMTRAERLAKMAKAKSFSGGKRFRDGRYKLAVKECTLEDKRGGKVYFFARLVVMSSTKISVWSPLADKAMDVEPNAIGETIDWMQETCVEDHPGDGNVKKFICTLFGVPEPEETDEDGMKEYTDTLSEICDLDEKGNSLAAKDRKFPARGMVIAMETRRIVTSKKGKEIVVQDWTHLPQTEPEKVAVCKWLDDVAKAADAAKSAA
jgi:hypothetical protein